MPDKPLPPCTPAREGEIGFHGGEAVICRSGRWEPFVPGGPPDRIREVDADQDRGEGTARPETAR